MRLRSVFTVFALVSAQSLTACKDPRELPPTTEYWEPVAASAVPAELRRLRTVLQPLPEHVDVDAAKASLGQRLFHDTVLSADNTLSCASCHDVAHGGVDGHRTSTGIRGQVGPINAPTVLNARYNVLQFWDGRAANLREQAAGPVANPAEMGSTWPAVVAALGRNPAYVTAFAASYHDGITADNARDAIATYEESLVTPGVADRFLRGDDTALDGDAREGARLFESVGCTSCHNGIGVGGGSFQRLGAVRDYFALRGGARTAADDGRFNVTHQASDRSVFKVPLLRNVAETGPWFHDGWARTLDDAVRTMDAVQLGRDLDATQVRQLVAFLRTLSGPLPAGALPPAAPAPAAAAPAAPVPPHA